MTAIEWTDKTWNPFVGCSKISEGCRNCYAINQAYRNNAIAKTMPTKGRMRYYEGLTQKKGDHT
jgi:protein gp37